MPQLDEAIKQRIVEELIRDISVDGSSIAVTIVNGVVTLKGKVPTLFNKLAAIDDALAVHGIIEVIDQITVDRQTAEKRISDEELERLLWDKISRTGDITVNDLRVGSTDGTVSITGTVAAYWQKVFVDNIASREPGVSAIDNHLKVVPKETISDISLAKNIFSALERKENVDAGKINVEVFGGQVTLTGTLSHRQERKEAADVAVYAEGVTNIVNKLTIRR